MARLYTLYKEEIAKKLKDQFSYKNAMQIPKIEKICINMGVGSDAVKDKNAVNAAVDDLTLIAGQKPVVRLAKKSEATFKLRKGMPIGCSVTLRKQKMYEFLDRLVNIALPRIRDFRGFSKRSFDRNGNFSLGLKEQIVFPEINYDNISAIRGLDITIVTSANTDEEGKALLEKFNLPFVN